jgi:hypothetical protein
MFACLLAKYSARVVGMYGTSAFVSPDSQDMCPCYQVLISAEYNDISRRIRKKSAGLPMRSLHLAQGTDLADLVTATALATMLSSFAWNPQCLERGNSIWRLCTLPDASPQNEEQEEWREGSQRYSRGESCLRRKAL